MEQRYDADGRQGGGRHRGVRRVTKMFHHTYYHWCEEGVRGVGGVVSRVGLGCRAFECTTFIPRHDTHTHTHVRMHIQACAALILNTPLAIIIFI